MKKNFKRIALILLAIILVSGCTMKMNMNMVISKNKNIKASILFAMDDEMIDTAITMSNTGDMPTSESDVKKYTDKERWEYLEGDNNPLGQDFNDFEVKKYDKDGYKGYIATKELGSIDKLSTTDASEKQNILGSDEAFDGKLFVKESANVYSSNMKIDLEGDETELETYKTYGAAYEMKLIIEFPTVPLSNNADEVSKDGKTLTWNLLDSKDVDFKFDFKKSGKITTSKKETEKDKNTETLDEHAKNRIKFIIIAAIIGTFLFITTIVVVIVLVVVLSNKKKNTQPVQTIINEPQTIVEDKTKVEETEEKKEEKTE